VPDFTIFEGLGIRESKRPINAFSIHQEKDMPRQILRMGLLVVVALSGAALPWANASSPVQKDKAKVHEIGAGNGLKIESALTVNDPKDRVQKDSYSKVFLVKLTAGTNYVLRMNAKDEDELDAFLRVEDAAGKELAFNDDADGENTLNARIDFKCEKDGTYRVICTSFNEAETGNFTLLVKRAD